VILYVTLTRQRIFAGTLCATARQRQADIIGDGTAEEKERNAAEQRLLTAAFRGNDAAFSDLVARYQRPVYGLCYRFLKGPDAEDAAQETFLRAFVHRQDFDPERSVLPWLLTIASRLCIDRLRVARRFSAGGDILETAADQGPSPETLAGDRESMVTVAQALSKLPPGQREAIVHHHLHGLPYGEVATVLDVPIGTVMTWLHRARNALRRALEDTTRSRPAAGGSHD